MPNLQQTIEQNKFRNKICQILKEHGISPDGKCDNYSDDEILDSLSKLGQSYSVVNAVLKSGQGIRIDKYDNGRTYKISSNGNGVFGSEIKHKGLGIDITKEVPINDAISKVIDAIDTAKNTAIHAPVFNSIKTQKANQSGELAYTTKNLAGDIVTGVITGLTPSGWYLVLDLVSQTEPYIIDLVPMLSDMYRSSVEQSRRDMILLVQKVMEKHIALYHTAGKKDDLGNIDNPFEPKFPKPDDKKPDDKKPDDGGVCPNQEDFLKEINKLFKLN